MPIAQDERDALDMGFVIDRHLRSLVVLLRLVIARFNQDRCVQTAGSLTFTTLLALVPLFTIAFALFTAFPLFEDWSNAFKIFLLTTLVPEMGGKVITVYMQQFADNAAKLTAVGLAFLALTALMLMGTIEKAFNAIWRARRARSPVQRFVTYWVALTVGPLLIGASISLTSWLITESMGLAGDLEQTQAFALRILPVVLNAVAFAAIYLMIPNRPVAVRDALIGGTAAALAFELMKRAFGLYVQLFPTYSLIYGAFATLPIFLLWIYLSWLIVLFGAVVVAVLPWWRVGVRQKSEQPGSTFLLVLRLIEAMYQAQQRADTPGPAELAGRIGVPEEDIEPVLERMERERWVRRVQPVGWVLILDPGTLTLRDVYRAFVYASPREAATAGLLAVAAAEHMRHIEDGLDITLRALLDSNVLVSECGETQAGSEPASTKQSHASR